MRVGLVVPGFSSDATDWCIPALRHLARMLAGADDVRVIAVRYPYRADRYMIEGADVIALGGAAGRGARTASLWQRALSTMAAEHRRRPFDVLHAFWATESGLLAAVAGRLLRVPTLVSLAGGELVALNDIGYGDQRIAWERFKVAASLQLASRVTAGSESLMTLARRHVVASKLHRAPLGVDSALFSPPETVTLEAQRYVHVGTLTPVKDQATLLRAFASLPAEATLEIVGDGPLRGKLSKLASELGVAPRVCFRGEADHGALPPVYRGARALVLSSRHEAQGMVALEAAACGVPVVGTNVGVIPEITTGVVPVGAPDLLSDAMATPTTVLAAEVIGRQFSLEVCTDRFRALYGDQRLKSQ